MELVSPEPHAPAKTPYPHAGMAGQMNPSGGPARPILIQAVDLRKEYTTGRGRLVLFDGLSFEVAEGEMLAIVGESGAGKSTLLHILGALDTPSGGDVYCASIQLRTLSSRQAASFRNREVGYVWQFHYLLPEFTAVENVAMPLLARGESKGAALKTAGEMAGRGGIGRPGTASGGRAFRRRAAARFSGESPGDWSKGVAG